MSMPRILAIDLAQHFGWACNIYPDITVIPSGNEKMKTKTREHDFLDWIVWALRAYSPDAVVYEDVKRHMSTAAAHSYGGYRALMFAACQECKIKTYGVGVKVWKLHITGNGNASKDEDVAAVNARGYNITDHNEADALALLLYAIDTNLVEIEK
jgi:Holliday junction resolvasome RuvABC endonuclease subunit